MNIPSPSTIVACIRDARCLIVVVLLFIIPPMLAWCEAPQVSTEEAEFFFKSQVLPVLEKNCYSCHSHAAKKSKGGLMLDSRSGWAKGGDSGPAVVPGNPEASLLIRAARYDDLEMPPTGKLSAESIAILEKWVKAGAHDPRTLDKSVPRAKARGSSAGMASDGRQHWAFQPIPRNPIAVPAVRNDTWPRDELDRFLLARLEARGLHPVQDADPYTWLRRVSLDLAGLPPTPDEIATFIRDCAPANDQGGANQNANIQAARAKVVDRLLTSRAYGERWGRHWLDLVGYADQIGTANDIFAEHAWRYRDYVLDAFHSDMPYDRFIREQIAGDLLNYLTSQEQNAALVATGFLLLGDLTIVEADKSKLAVDVADQQVDKIGRAFLGMTIGCARCHDHKFDPISQHDYYALAGILLATDSIQKASWGVWSWPNVQPLPESEHARAERAARQERHQQQLHRLYGEREALRARKREVDAALAPMPLAATPSAQAVVENTAPPRNLVGAALPEAARIALTNIQRQAADRLRELDAELLHAEFFTPAPPQVFAVRDVSKPTDMRVTIRGNPHAPGELVPRGFLSVVKAGPTPPIPAGQSGRQQLADWIANPRNPLTARVAVNRMWQKLFGVGLVRTVDYFGLPGDRPTHPELLDFLAQRFVDAGWSQRQLLRSLVLSRAYGLSSSTDSRPDSRASSVDGDNTLLWRAHRRRLDAEAIRDSLLLVSGKLLESRGGPALPLEYRENTGNLAKGDVNPPSFRLARFRPEQEYERTVYLPVVRSAPQAGPADLRNVFDFTLPGDFAGQRPVTAVPTQALFLMNAKLLKDRAQDLAQLISRETGNNPARVEKLWLRVLGRPCTTEELRDALEFLGPSIAQPASPAALIRWGELCHALFASNEFLMRL